MSSNGKINDLGETGEAAGRGMAAGVLQHLSKAVPQQLPPALSFQESKGRDAGESWMRRCAECN